MKLLGFRIYYDEDSWELDEVRVRENFMAEPALNRADILRDCMDYFTEQYHATVREMEESYGPGGHVSS